MKTSSTTNTSSALDYSSFGMVTVVSNWSGGSEYRYGFGGHEKDDEIKGSGNSYTTQFRGYDPRLGRWLSIDPLTGIYPDISPYASFMNNPIFFTDKDGRVLRDQDGNIVYTKDGNSYWVKFNGQNLQVQNVFIYTNEGKKVSVQMVTDVTDVVTGNSVKDGTTKNTYICYGLSMTEGKFIPNSEHSVSNTLVLDKMGKSDLTPKEVKDNLQTDYTKIQDGDILVFYEDKVNRETGNTEEGVVTHSAIWSESEGKCISKNGYNEIGMYNLDELKNIYGKNTGFFTPQEDKKVNIEGNSGPVYGTTEVSESDVKKVIE